MEKYRKRGLEIAFRFLWFLLLEVGMLSGVYASRELGLGVQVLMAALVGLVIVLLFIESLSDDTPPDQWPEIIP